MQGEADDDVEGLNLFKQFKIRRLNTAGLSTGVRWHSYKSEANRTPTYDFEDQYTTTILRSLLYLCEETRLRPPSLKFKYKLSLSFAPLCLTHLALPFSRALLQVSLQTPALAHPHVVSRLLPSPHSSLAPLPEALTHSRT